MTDEDVLLHVISDRVLTFSGASWVFQATMVRKLGEAFREATRAIFRHIFGKIQQSRHVWALLRYMHLEGA